MKWIWKVFRWLIHVLGCLCGSLLGWIFGWIPRLKKHMTGIEFEQYVYEILKRLGYKHVRLTRQSGDYGVDILASYRGVRYAFQCKYYSKPVGVSAIQQAYSGCEYYDYDEAVVVTNQTFTRQAYALAKNNGVILWDGEKLALMRRRANRHALFYRFHHLDPHPYEAILQIIVDAGYASSDLLYQETQISLSRIDYILDDLEFYDIVSCEDEYGLRDVYISSIEEGIKLLEKRPI